MRFAYADPPYPGQSARYYRNHPDYAGEVDHAELITRLARDYPDGWALSTNAVSLAAVLALCPPAARVAVWHKTSDPHPGQDGWWYCWEPVIVTGGRRTGVVRNVLTCGTRGNAGRFPGAKPPEFSRWVFRLLGATLEDHLDDLYPGSGAVSDEWERYRAQPQLPEPKVRFTDSRHPRKTLRWLRNNAEPLPGFRA